MANKARKVVFVGDAGVGKTSIINAARGHGDVSPESTVGCAHFFVNKESANGVNVTLALWDTAGQETYQALVPLYIKGADVAILVFSVNDELTLRNIESWFDVCESATRIEHYMVVGNKIDLERVVDSSEALQLAKSLKGVEAQYFECSAVNGQGIAEPMRAVATTLDNKKRLVVVSDPEPIQRKECC